MVNQLPDYLFNKQIYRFIIWRCCEDDNKINSSRHHYSTTTQHHCCAREWKRKRRIGRWHRKFSVWEQRHCIWAAAFGRGNTRNFISTFFSKWIGIANTYHGFLAGLEKMCEGLFHLASCRKLGTLFQPKMVCTFLSKMYEQSRMSLCVMWKQKLKMA